MFIKNPLPRISMTSSSTSGCITLSSYTVRTLLTRLVEKGALKVVEQEGSPRLYAPAVKRETCVKAESESFLGRIFQGAAKPLLVHFARNARLTPDEVRELKKLLDQSIEPKNQP